MKKIIASIVFIFLFIWQDGLTQTTNTFSHFFAGTNPPYGTTEFVFADILETADSGFVKCFSTSPFNIPHAQAIFLKIDKYGIEQYRKVIEDTIYHYEIGGLIKCKQYGYVGEYRRGKWGVPDQKIYLVKYNDVGDSLWTILDSVRQFTFPYGIVESSDHKIAVTGFTFDTLANGTSGYGVGFLNIYDSSGVKINSHQYNLTGSNYFHDVIECSDSGFFLVGGSYLSSNWRSWLVKTDSLGVFQSQQIWTNGGIGQLNESIIQLNDGNYLIAGDKILSNNYNYGRAQLRKIDSNGNTIWARTYASTVHLGANGFYDCRERADGTIVACGGISDLSSYPQSWLIQTDSLGNLLFERTLSSDTISNTFFKLNLCKDGGIILAGSGINYQFGDSTSDMRIVKVDSLGCDSMACAIYTGIEEDIQKQEKGIFVYPNPANSHLTIQLNSLPRNASKITVQMFDVSGKLVLADEHWNNEQQFYNLNISNIDNGIYFLQVSNNQRTFVKKIIVQH